MVVDWVKLTEIAKGNLLFFMGASNLDMKTGWEWLNANATAETGVSAPFCARMHGDLVEPLTAADKFSRRLMKPCQWIKQIKRLVGRHPRSLGEDRACAVVPCAEQGFRLKTVAEAMNYLPVVPRDARHLRRISAFPSLDNAVAVLNHYNRELGWVPAGGLDRFKTMAVRLHGGSGSAFTLQKMAWLLAQGSSPPLAQGSSPPLAQGSLSPLAQGSSSALSLPAAAAASGGLSLGSESESGAPPVSASSDSWREESPPPRRRAKRAAPALEDDETLPDPEGAGAAWDALGPVAPAVAAALRATVAKIKDDIRPMQASIAEWEREVADLEPAIRETRASLAELERKVADRETVIRETRASIAEWERGAAALETSIRAAAAGAKRPKLK